MSFRRSRRSPKATRWRSNTSAIAAIGPYASSWSSSPCPRPWCSCSTTSTGPTPHRSSCSAHCAAALTEELALLSHTARRMLEGAAVARDPFEPELAAAAAGTSGNSTMDALDELLQLDLIRQTEVPRRFRFRHPLVRRAVYESTP